MKKIEVNGITYEVEKDYKNAFDIETVQSKLTEHFCDYDYILGDIAYNKLRLKGFYNTNSSKKEKWNDIAYLEDKKVNLNTDYWKGYFIHLLSDHYFSEKYFKQEIYNAKKNKEKLYNDYDCLNKELLKKYNIEVLEETKKYMNCFDEKPKYLEINKVEKFIEDMSNINLKEQEQLIRQKGMEGIK